MNTLLLALTLSAGPLPPQAPPVDMPPQAPAVDELMMYNDLLTRVEAGERGLLIVGIADKHVGKLRAVEARGFGKLPDGEYDCFLFNGVPSMEKREVQRKEVSRVATPFGITKDTAVPTAVGSRTPYADTPRPVTYTLVPTAARGGSTDGCPPSG